MSIAIGLVSKMGAVVATDSLRVEPKCASFTLEYDKTFRIPFWLIGASVGLLEYSGKTIAEHVASALGKKWRSAAAFNQQLSRYFSETLAAADVVFQDRRLDLLFIVRPRQRHEHVRISSLKIAPNEDGRTFLLEPQFLPLWTVAGDPGASVPVEAALKNLEPQLNAYSLRQLVALADRLIRDGISAAGPDLDCPQYKACGGEPCFQSLPFR